MPEIQEVVEAGVAAHEQFVKENREIDLAGSQGNLDECLKEKLANERRAAETDDGGG